MRPATSVSRLAMASVLLLLVVRGAYAYVWRGFILHEGACLQPDVWVTLSDFTITSWLNVRNTIVGDNHVNEHDLIVDYSRDIRGVTVSAGYTNYRILGVFPRKLLGGFTVAFK